MIEICVDGGVKNPLIDFHYGLPLEKCSDEKLDWLIKNLTANFYKLFSCSTNIAQIQKDYLPKELATNEGDVKVLNLQMFSINSIEYFFIKVNTIFELCYQAFDILCSPREKYGKNKKKHKILSEEFELYTKETNEEIDIQWYESLNNVRNSIIHGGFSIKSFIDEERLLFQVYNSELDEQLNIDFGFFKKDSPLIYMDFYTNFYTKIVHLYIERFFNFILYKLEASAPKDEELSRFEIMQRNSNKVWLIGDEKMFNLVSNTMIR